MTTDGTTDPETMTDDESTLGGMSHTNPYTGQVFGNTQTYSRGRTIAADGGEANAVSRSSSDESDGGEADSAPDAETLKDVDHKPDDEVDGAQGTFDRGEEAPDGTDDE